MICKNCHGKSRVIYDGNIKETSNLCPKCDIKPNECPICHTKLQSDKTIQCPICHSNWKEKIEPVKSESEVPKQQNTKSFKEKRQIVMKMMTKIIWAIIELVTIAFGASVFVTGIIDNRAEASGIGAFMVVLGLLLRSWKKDLFASKDKTVQDDDKKVKPKASDKNVIIGLLAITAFTLWGINHVNIQDNASAIVNFKSKIQNNASAIEYFKFKE